LIGIVSVENKIGIEAQIKLSWKHVDWDKFGGFFESTYCDELMIQGFGANQLWNNFAKKLDDFALWPAHQKQKTKPTMPTIKNQHLV
jgi:hypothetical protein